MNRKYIVMIISILVSTYFVNSSNISISGIEEFLNIEMAAVKQTINHISQGDLTTNSKIPQNGTGGAFGYGIITDKGIIVATTHSGVLDSEKQTHENDPIFHTHYVKLGTVKACGSNLGVMDITFESSGQLAVNEKNVIFNSLPETSEGISQGGNM